MASGSFARSEGPAGVRASGSGGTVVGGGNTFRYFERYSQPASEGLIVAAGASARRGAGRARFGQFNGKVTMEGHAGLQGVIDSDVMTPGWRLGEPGSLGLPGVVMYDEDDDFEDEDDEMFEDDDFEEGGDADEEFIDDEEGADETEDLGEDEEEDEDEEL